MKSNFVVNKFLLLFDLFLVLKNKLFCQEEFGHSIFLRNQHLLQQQWLYLIAIWLLLIMITSESLSAYFISIIAPANFSNNIKINRHWLLTFARNGFCSVKTIINQSKRILEDEDVFVTLRRCSIALMVF